MHTIRSWKGQIREYFCWILIFEDGEYILYKLQGSFGIFLYKNISFTVWMSGVRTSSDLPLSRHYFQNTRDFLFFVDINDRDHVVEYMDELHSMLNKVQLCTRMCAFWHYRIQMPTGNSAKRHLWPTCSYARWCALSGIIHLLLNLCLYSVTNQRLDAEIEPTMHMRTEEKIIIYFSHHWEAINAFRLSGQAETLHVNGAPYRFTLEAFRYTSYDRASQLKNYGSSKTHATLFTIVCNYRADRSHIVHLIMQHITWTTWKIYLPLLAWLELSKTYLFLLT